MKPSDIIAYARNEVTNHSIYVWGGQGERTDRLTLAVIQEMETSNSRVADILEYLAKCVRAGYDMRDSKAFDCSGLIVNFLLKQGVINYDLTANDLFRACKTIPVKDAKAGDLVFKSLSGGTYGHVGIVTGEGTVIEAKGRAYGVVESKLGKDWLAAGHPSWYEPEIYTFSKLLRAGSKGNDVKVMQEYLKTNGYLAGEADGIFGKMTEKALVKFQVKTGLTPDGIFGKMTCEKMGYIWK